MRTAPRCYWQLLVVRDACSLLDTSLRPPVDLQQPSRVRIDQVNSRTDRAGDWLESIFRAFGWIVRDKCLDVVSGHRAPVDKGRHEASNRNDCGAVNYGCLRSQGTTADRGQHRQVAGVIAPTVKREAEKVLSPSHVGALDLLATQSRSY